MHEIIEKRIFSKGKELVLTNQKAVYIADERTLVIADLHLGKTAHFRRHGIAIPSSVMFHDLEKLSSLIRYFDTSRLVVVGDMFHASSNNDLTVFSQWREQFQHLSIHLVRGNHDRLSEKQYTELGINETSDELEISPFILVHDAIEPVHERTVICGHRHPGRAVHGKGRQWIKLPCYIVSENRIILPAFSHFTGLDTSVPGEDHVCYLVSEKGIFEV